MLDWRCLILPIVFVVGAEIGWYLALRQARARREYWQSVFKFGEDDWPDDDNSDPVLPQCITCLFYTLSGGDGDWCYMCKEPPETEGKCEQWKEKGK